MTPELAAQAIIREGLARPVILNQVESQADWDRAERFALRYWQRPAWRCGRAAFGKGSAAG